MNLGGLLQLLRESILNDHSDRIAGSSDRLWSDGTLVTFINEAQRRFAVKGLVLRDGRTADVTQVTLVSGQSEYILHRAVIAVMSARREDQQADLTRVGHAALGAYTTPTENWVDPGTFDTWPNGNPVAYATDESLSEDTGTPFEQVVLRVFPTPGDDQADQVLQLRVVRKPLNALTADDLDAIPEIPEDHHIEMLDWAAYLALRIVDDDAGSANRADGFRQSFEAHVAEARKLAMRKLFAPTAWGFGRGGFSWEP